MSASSPKEARHSPLYKNSFHLLLKSQPASTQNEMILNLLMRIDGKLTEQAMKITKIEEKLHQLAAFVHQNKGTKTPTSEAQATAAMTNSFVTSGY
ncbi:Uncharacterized protein TCM_018868 [Theobroma cacao]|uniref:Uncharacterized protein n=1 Tax=Theobroma cacao TaxID=3641 RepID=A0A061EFR7_THECC|nr:Uncharacterized protein TCM_018868 [Theobroma cacao]